MEDGDEKVELMKRRDEEKEKVSQFVCSRLPEFAMEGVVEKCLTLIRFSKGNENRLSLAVVGHPFLNLSAEVLVLLSFFLSSASLKMK